MESVESSNFDVKEYFAKIKKALHNLGYGDRIIDISVAVTLYENYGKDVSEETFANEVLGVKTTKYRKAKANNTKIKILSNDSLNGEEIEVLKQKLFSLGYSMTKVNYDEFRVLYNTFGYGLLERTFAIKVLNLGYGNFRNIKENNGSNAIILKNSGNIENTISKMIEEGYENYVIRGYDDFLALYSKFGYSFSMTFFSENILKISYDDYRRLRKTKVELRVLSSDKSDNAIENLKRVLENNGYTGMVINYEDFLKLYQEYGTLFSEKDFALKVLNLSLDSYKSLKLKNTRAKILNDRNSNYNYQSIKDELVKQGFCNKAIDYEEFKQLYLDYGNGIDAKEFALYVLDLSLDGYRALRRINNTDKFKILKNEIPKEIERIKRIIISKGYSNKKIYYEELHALYLEYATFINERQFAMQVLEIGSSHYQNIKYSLKNNKRIGVVVLPFKELTIDDIRKIKEELIEKGYEGARLTSEEIDKLYLNYSSIMSRSRFLEDILGIFKVPYNPNYKITVLRKTDNLDDDEIEKLKKEIFNSGYYYKKIRPEVVDELYRMYGSELTYNTFVTKVLGITRKQIGDAKIHNSLVRVIDINVKNTMEMISRKHLTEIRYYSKDEIISICNNYNVSLDDFLLYSFLRNVEHNHDTYIELYKNVLINHDQLWIGNNRVSNEIISKYYTEIENKIMDVIKSVRKMYPIAYGNNQTAKDDFQELLLFFIENGSEIEKNFMVYDDDNWIRCFYNKLKRRLLINVYNRIRVSTSIIDYYGNSYKDGRDKEFADEKTDTEETAIESLESNDNSKKDSCVLSFGQLLLNGKSIVEAKKIICDDYSISEVDFLNYMSLYMDNHGIQNFDLSILVVDKKSDSVSAKKIKLKTN